MEWWDRLAIAIIRQACMDYQRARKRLIDGKLSERRKQIEYRDYIQSKAFFYTRWYETLTSLDGAFLVNKLDTIPVAKLEFFLGGEPNV